MVGLHVIRTRRSTHPEPQASVTDSFIAEKFKQSNGKFDTDVANDFAQQLHGWRSELQQQVYDTRLSEQLLREVQTYRDAWKNAHKQGTFGGGRILQGMDIGVLPKADAIVKMIEDGESATSIKSATEEFVDTYSPYESPNAVVTQWYNNNQSLALPRHIFSPWKRRQNDSRAVEAINLVVEDEEHINIISEALQREVSPGYCLSGEDIEVLKAHDFDLSSLNPQSGAFWGQRSFQDIAQSSAEHASEYPRPDEKIIYKGPRYRSNFSTKMNAYTWRDGRKHKFKVKIGPEVHPEIIARNIREYLGFYQDPMKHYPQLKMYLGDKSYSQWERDLQLKYGTDQIRRHMLSRGKDEETGESWVVFRDVAVEARPKSEIRVAAVDYGSYDGANRREVRASALIYGFLAQGDTDRKNFREVLVKDESSGQWRTEHRMHDVGLSLGRSPVLLRRPRDILNFPLTRNKPLEYDRKYVWADKMGNVSFLWNDFFQRVRDHQSATYDDLKWAARLVASLTTEQITDAVIQGGVPEELVLSYVFHITNMRNRAVKAFGLVPGEPTVPGRGPVQNDEVKVPFDVIRLADGHEVIKNGRIVGTYFPGSTIYPKLQETWFTRINKLLALANKMSIGRGITERFDHWDASFGPVARIDNHVGGALWQDVVPISPGIVAIISRVVSPNKFYCGAEGVAHPYVVRDFISFSIGLGTPTLSSALAKFGPEAAVSVQLARKSFEHVHFSETVLEGYKSPLLVQKLLAKGSLERHAVASLSPGEFFREHRSVGASVAAHLGLGLKVPFVGMASVGGSGSIEVGQTYWTTVTYAKDQLGALHLLLEKDAESTAGAQIEAANVTAPGVVNASAFAVGGHQNHIRQDFWNIEVIPAAYNLESATRAVPSRGKKADDLVNSLQVLRRQPQLVLPEYRDSVDIPDNVRLRFHVSAEKDESREAGQLLYLLSHDRARDKTDFRVETPEHEYEFYAQSKAKRGYTGVEKTLLDLSTKNAWVRQGTSKRLAVELDRDNARSLVVMIDVFDFHRVLSRSGLDKLIARLNRRYSRTVDDPFFGTPPETKLEPYRRVYANARIYINGDKLLHLVEETEPHELRRRIDAALQDAQNRRQGEGQRIRGAADRLDLRRIHRKAERAAQSLGAAVDRLDRKLSGAQSDQRPAADPEVRRLQEAVASEALRLVNGLYKSKLGVAALQSLLGDDGMLVVGEIFGIFDRTSMLQDPDWTSRLRFAGKAWGKLTNSPQMARYVRQEQPTPANELAAMDVPLERLIGTVATGHPGSRVGLGRR